MRWLLPRVRAEHPDRHQGRGRRARHGEEAERGTKLRLWRAESEEWRTRGI